MSTSTSRRARRTRTVVCAAAAALLTGATASYFAQDALARAPDRKTVARVDTRRRAGKREARPGPASAPAEQPIAPSILPARDGLPEVLVFPPYDTSARRPMAVMLHGMCDAPEYECPYFADSIRKSHWLICPRASLRCAGGGAIWSYQKRAETVEAAVERVKATFPDKLDESPGRVLMGFSLGAITSMHLAHTGAGRWSSVILIGAKVYPSAKLLRRAGVGRLLMVAGDYDMMRWHMYNESRRLQRQGFASAFLSLGKIGHQFPANMNTLMGQALAWANGNDAALGTGS